LITTIFVLIVIGGVGMVAGMTGGLVAGLIVMAYFYSGGFIPLWLLSITLFGGFIMIVAMTKKN
jgi:hypothetical protein